LGYVLGKPGPRRELPTAVGVPARGRIRAKNLRLAALMKVQSTTVRMYKRPLSYDISNLAAPKTEVINTNIRHKYVKQNAAVPKFKLSKDWTLLFAAHEVGTLEPFY
jgi:hypothetical protein